MLSIEGFIGSFKIKGIFWLSMSKDLPKHNNISSVCRESLVNREALVLLVTVDRLGQLDLLDLLDLPESLAERSGLNINDDKIAVFTVQEIIP